MNNKIYLSGKITIEYIVDDASIDIDEIVEEIENTLINEGYENDIETTSNFIKIEIDKDDIDEVVELIEEVLEGVN